jgi:hypothetical protein
MTLSERIRLTWNYGKPMFLVGGIYIVFCAFLLVKGFSYSFFVDAFILKVFLTAVTLFLVKQFRDRDAIFFYINLGLSRRKLLISVILADFLVLAVLLTIVLQVHG